MANAVEVKDDNFATEIEQHAGLSVVDFWATWCAPCRMIAPAVEAIAERYACRVKVGKLNVDDNLSVTSRYNIRGIPTLLLFKGGQIQEQIVGATSQDAIGKLVEKHL